MVFYPGQPAVAGREEILLAYFRDFFGQAGGDVLEDHGKHLVMLRQQSDGSWKVFRDMDNSDKPLTQSTRGAGEQADAGDGIRPPLHRHVVGPHRDG